MKTLCLSFVVVLSGLMLFSLSLGQQPNRPVIPKTWDLQAVDAFQMQLADPNLRRLSYSTTLHKQHVAAGGWLQCRSRKNDALNIPINTDPNLALKTRRGTGYYKVPSLKGVWYRGPFEHNGSVATLEDWFDIRRLRDDYVPTGFRGFGVATRAVKGHEFGLRLTLEKRTALIEFLKTL